MTDYFKSFKVGNRLNPNDEKLNIKFNGFHTDKLEQKIELGDYVVGFFSSRSIRFFRVELFTAKSVGWTTQKYNYNYNHDTKIKERTRIEGEYYKEFIHPSYCVVLRKSFEERPEGWKNITTSYMFPEDTTNETPKVSKI